MYTEDVLNELTPIAEKFIFENNRSLYIPFFIEAEKFCIENDILIGGKIGLDILMHKALTKDSFMWHLYTDDVYNIARDLTDTLYNVKSNHIDVRTIGLRTDIKHHEFTIWINAVMIFKIYSLDKYRGVKLISVMGPTSMPGYFYETTLKPVKLIPEEIQLIEIYRTLYSPEKSDLWQEYLTIEDNIYSSMRKNIIDKQYIDGGSAFNKINCDKLLLRKLIPGENVLIGDYAINNLENPTLEINKTKSRLQFITSSDIKTLVKKVSSILTYDNNSLRKIGSNIKVTFAKFNLNIPSDFQIIKYTLYAVINNEQIPIADVFNSLEYELIPYSNVDFEGKKLKIGNPFVLLKFQFIDIWLIKLIINLNKNKQLESLILKNVQNSDELRKKIKGMSDIFQTENYAGIYINELVAKKKLIKEINERFPIYYPTKKSNNDL
jgi:hypothetical protein